MARNIVAIAVLVLGVFLILYGLGFIPNLPGGGGSGGGGGGGGGGGTTTTALQKGTLIIKAKDSNGNIFDAAIFVDGRQVGRGSVTLQVDPYRRYNVSFEERQGYYTPAQQTVELWPGQTVTLETIYYPKVPYVGTYLLTVYVQECNVVNACFPYINVDVKLDDGQSGRTGNDGRVTFRVLPGERTIKVLLANGLTQEKTVTVNRDMETTVTIRTSGLTVLPTITADLFTIALFIALAVGVMYILRRR